MLEDQQALERLRALRLQAQEQRLGLFDYVVRTTVSTPGVISIILGVTRPEQLEQAIRALDDQPSVSAPGCGLSA